MESQCNDVDKTIKPESGIKRLPCRLQLGRIEGNREVQGAEMASLNIGFTNCVVVFFDIISKVSLNNHYSSPFISSL